MAKQDGSSQQPSTNQAGGTNASPERCVLFAQALQRGLSQADAAAAAGYASTKRKSLAQIGSRLAQHPLVIQEQERLREAAATAAVLSQQEALEILTRHARGGRLLNDKGELDADTTVALDKAGLLESYEETQTSGEKSSSLRRRLKLESRQGAIDRLAKILGWNKPEKHEVMHQDDLIGMTTAQLNDELDQHKADDLV